MHVCARVTSTGAHSHHRRSFVHFSLCKSQMKAQLLLAALTTLAVHATRYNLQDIDLADRVQAEQDLFGGVDPTTVPLPESVAQVEDMIRSAADVATDVRDVQEYPLNQGRGKYDREALVIPPLDDVSVLTDTNEYTSTPHAPKEQEGYYYPARQRVKKSWRKMCTKFEGCFDKYMRPVGRYIVNEVEPRVARGVDALGYGMTAPGRWAKRLKERAAAEEEQEQERYDMFHRMKQWKPLEPVREVGRSFKKYSNKKAEEVCEFGREVEGKCRDFGRGFKRRVKKLRKREPLAEEDEMAAPQDENGRFTEI